MFEAEVLGQFRSNTGNTQNHLKAEVLRMAVVLEPFWLGIPNNPQKATSKDGKHLRPPSRPKLTT